MAIKAELSQLLLDLKGLESTWAIKFPQRASGGLNSISGFRYQFQVFLLELLDKWINSSDEERSNVEHFITTLEMLSDFHDIRKSGLIIAT